MGMSTHIRSATSYACYPLLITAGPLWRFDGQPGDVTAPAADRFRSPGDISRTRCSEVGVRTASFATTFRQNFSRGSTARPGAAGVQAVFKPCGAGGEGTNERAGSPCSGPGPAPP